jgi:hypothetical protein
MANSKPVKKEVNSTVILPPLVFPGWYYKTFKAVILGPISQNFFGVNLLALFCKLDHFIT